MDKNKNIPDDNELVLCTVTKIYPTCVFANLEEYHNKSGMIHISEISPGRIRNIHDYVKIGKKIICKVLRIDLEKGHIDLSLRRVSEGQKREKAEIIKKQQKSFKIVEFVADKLKLKADKLHEDILDQVGEEYPTLHDFFEEYVADEKAMDRIKLDKKTKDFLCEVIKQRIKPPVVVIEGEIKLKTFAPDGVSTVKKILTEAENIDEAVDIRYKGAGVYTATITHDNYKDAERILENLTKNLESTSKKNEVDYGFNRLEKKGKKASA